MACPFGYGSSALPAPSTNTGPIAPNGNDDNQNHEKKNSLTSSGMNVSFEKATIMSPEDRACGARASSASCSDKSTKSTDGTRASSSVKTAPSMTPKHNILRAMTDSNNTTENPYYRDYLQLQTVLSCQQPISTKVGTEAHDEMLFIIIHQTYELWFKQIIHELQSIYDMMLPEYVTPVSIQTAVNRLARIHKIQATLVKQMDILDTMTPMAFLEFRDYLVPASGFQSAQFRIIELMMGLPIDKRKYATEKFLLGVMDEDDRKMILALNGKDSLRDLVERWLERIPFLGDDDESEDSWPQQYKEAATSMLDKDEIMIRELFGDDEVRLEQELMNLNLTRKLFDSLFNVQAHDEMIARGTRTMSQRATLAGIFVCLYRDEPMLAGPYKLIESLIELDEGFVNWRWRHVSTAHRQIGIKMGTGGSSGGEYLARAAQENKPFKDLGNLVSFLIPQSAVPPLSPEIRSRLGFKVDDIKPSWIGA